MLDFSVSFAHCLYFY